MRVYPVSSINQISSKGSVDKKTMDLFCDMNNGWMEKADKMKTLPLINTCLFSSERINNVIINLSIIMERFGHACKLTFAKSEKKPKYRFFIENEHSNYKLICKDVEFSQNKNSMQDITELENLENSVSKLNPYKENSNFIIQRKAESKGIIYDKEFEPDADYIFLEDKLVGKEPKPEATMQDVKEFLDAAKEEGLFNG